MAGTPFARCGITVREVTANSPAAKAGLKDDDVILKVDDRAMKNVDEFLRAIATRKPGDKVSLQVRREGKEQTVTATLGERPGGFGTSVQPPGGLTPGGLTPGGLTPGGFGPPGHAAFLGVQVEPLTADLKTKLNVKADSGVVVTHVSPKSAASEAGLQANDVIVSADSTKVKNPADLRKAVQQAGVGKQITLHGLRGSESMSLTATLHGMPTNLVPWLMDGFSPLTDLESQWDQVNTIRDLQRRIEALEHRIREMDKRTGSPHK